MVQVKGRGGVDLILVDQFYVCNRTAVAPTNLDGIEVNITCIIFNISQIEFHFTVITNGKSTLSERTAIALLTVHQHTYNHTWRALDNHCGIIGQIGVSYVIYATSSCNSATTSELCAELIIEINITVLTVNACISTVAIPMIEHVWR